MRLEVLLNLMNWVVVLLMNVLHLETNLREEFLVFHKLVVLVNRYFLLKFRTEEKVQDSLKRHLSLIFPDPNDIYLILPQVLYL